ncbi:RbsD/FucU domain-containing protein [Stakelama saccharophila]|uniref:RbsD/FucU domain-containing protein n=1 Tax=Stakelama saccharophila TaxID=3075605 RepID=UPI003D7801A4
MLKGIDPVLGPKSLAILRAMGHGDEIAIVDANFPASANAQRLVRADGHPLDRMLDAIRRDDNHVRAVLIGGDRANLAAPRHDGDRAAILGGRDQAVIVEPRDTVRAAVGADIERAEFLARRDVDQVDRRAAISDHRSRPAIGQHTDRRVCEHSQARRTGIGRSDPRPSDGKGLCRMIDVHEQRATVR